MSARAPEEFFLTSSLFSQSDLVRLLGDVASGEGEGVGMDFAERLSLWVSAFDAIGLQGTVQSARTAADAAGPRAGTQERVATALTEALQRVRAALASAIAQDPLALLGRTPDSGYAPYQQRHQELQRRMEQMVGALRDQARQAIGRASPRLRELATLDAALEPVIARREQSLLPGAAVLLRRRFDALCPRGELPPADAAQMAIPPSQQAFAQAWRQTLLAELDLRLEPVVGLIEALNNEPIKQA